MIPLKLRKSKVFSNPDTYFASSHSAIRKDVANKILRNILREDKMGTCTWDYRVMRRAVKIKGTKKYDVSFGIYEVYFDNGRVEGWTTDPVEPHGDTLDDLKTDIKWMRQALKKPVLDYNKLDRQLKRRKRKPFSYKKEDYIPLDDLLKELESKKK